MAHICALWNKVLPDDGRLGFQLEDVVGDLVARGVLFGRGLFAEDGECLAFGISCFLSDDALTSFTEAPKAYLCLRLLGAASRGDMSSFLSLEETATQNAGDGLNLFILEYAQVTFDFDQRLAHTLLSRIVPEYLASHAGYNLRCTLHETEVSKGHIQEAGGNQRLFDINPQHPWSLSPNGLGPRAVYGMSRDNIVSLPATQVAKVLFVYSRPIFSLIPREQQVVSLALDGLTDLEIGAALGMSRDGVRNRWRAIYDQIETVAPETFGLDDSRRGEVSRGAEKRRRVLALLKDRPEELRPYTLKRGRD